MEMDADHGNHYAKSVSVDTDRLAFPITHQQLRTIHLPKTRKPATRSISHLYIAALTFTRASGNTDQDELVPS